MPGQNTFRLKAIRRLLGFYHLCWSVLSYKFTCQTLSLISSMRKYLRYTTVVFFQRSKGKFGTTKIFWFWTFLRFCPLTVFHPGLSDSRNFFILEKRRKRKRIFYFWWWWKRTCRWEKKGNRTGVEKCVKAREKRRDSIPSIIHFWRT